MGVDVWKLDISRAFFIYTTMELKITELNSGKIIIGKFEYKRKTIFHKKKPVLVEILNSDEFLKSNHIEYDSIWFYQNFDHVRDRCNIKTLEKAIDILDLAREIFSKNKIVYNV